MSIEINLLKFGTSLRRHVFSAAIINVLAAVPEQDMCWRVQLSAIQQRVKLSDTYRCVYNVTRRQADLEPCKGTPMCCTVHLSCSLEFIAMYRLNHHENYVFLSSETTLSFNKVRSSGML